MYCSNCGYKNSDESFFCEECGYKLSKEVKNKAGDSKKTVTGLGILLLVLILILVLFGGGKCSGNTNSSGNTNILPLKKWEIGKWEYVDNVNGYDAFYSDIEFYKDGTFYVNSPYLMVNSFEYVIEDDNIKLTAGMFIEHIKYSRHGDELYLYFDDGYNIYKKIN